MFFIAHNYNSVPFPLYECNEAQCRFAHFFTSPIFFSEQPSIWIHDDRDRLSKLFSKHRKTIRQVRWPLLVSVPFVSQLTKFGHLPNFHSENRRKIWLGTNVNNITLVYVNLFIFFVRYARWHNRTLELHFAHYTEGQHKSICLCHCQENSHKQKSRVNCQKSGQVCVPLYPFVWTNQV